MRIRWFSDAPAEPGLPNSMNSTRRSRWTRSRWTSCIASSRSTAILGPRTRFSPSGSAKAPSGLKRRPGVASKRRSTSLSIATWESYPLHRLRAEDPQLDLDLWYSGRDSSLPSTATPTSPAQLTMHNRDLLERRFVNGEDTRAAGVAFELERPRNEEVHKRRDLAAGRFHLHRRHRPRRPSQSPLLPRRPGAVSPAAARLGMSASAAVVEVVRGDLSAERADEVLEFWSARGFEGDAARARLPGVRLVAVDDKEKGLSRSTLRHRARGAIDRTSSLGLHKRDRPDDPMSSPRRCSTPAFEALAEEFAGGPPGSDRASVRHHRRSRADRSPPGSGLARHQAHLRRIPARRSPTPRAVLPRGEGRTRGSSSMSADQLAARDYRTDDRFVIEPLAESKSVTPDDVIALWSSEGVVAEAGSSPPDRPGSARRRRRWEPGSGVLQRLPRAKTSASGGSLELPDLRRLELSPQHRRRAAPLRQPRNCWSAAASEWRGHPARRRCCSSSRN